MVKRKVGERAEILVDTLDLEILSEIRKEELGVLELANKLNIQHKNLKPHLVKLINVGLILISKTKNRKILLILPENLYEQIGQVMSASGKSLRENAEEQSYFLKVLNKINSLEYQKQTLYDIDKELEKYDKNIKVRKEHHKLIEKIRKK